MQNPTQGGVYKRKKDGSLSLIKDSRTSPAKSKHDAVDKDSPATTKANQKEVTP